MDALKTIYEEQEKIMLISGIGALLHYDLATAMPKDAYKDRAEQMRYLRELSDDILRGKRLGTAVAHLKSKMKKKDSLGNKDAVVLRELAKEVSRTKKLPPEFVSRLARQQVIGQARWEEARAKDDFSIFEPELKRWVGLKRKQAAYLSNGGPYDALIDLYEEGMTADRYSKIFSYLKPELIRLLERIKSSSIYKRQKAIKLNVDRQDMDGLIEGLRKSMGIDTGRYLISRSSHPFTLMISKDDVRTTTRYLHPLDSLYSAIHEMGHALYNLNLPKRYENTFVFDGASFGLHESQSILWEKLIGKSKFFWKGFYKRFEKAAKTGLSLEELHRQVCLVRPSFIRVDADDVTYVLHIILRFEIERDLLKGKLKVKDAKHAWNRKMKEYLGLMPKTDNEGILQDIHWSMGEFGYFPSYALGNIYAAQLYKSLLKKTGIKEEIQGIEFSGCGAWLKSSFYRHGNSMKAEEIVRKATGQGLSPEDYIGFLNEKYARLYRL